MRKYLGVFERKITHEMALIEKQNLENHVILVGAGRTGRRLIAFFKAKKTPFLVVDFNPKTFTQLTAEKVPVIFGDINDPEIAEILNLAKAKTVISTISDLTDNLTLLEEVRNLRKKPITIMTALRKSEAVKYYEKGANYVVVPQTVAGEHIRHLLKVYGVGSETLAKMGKSNFKRLLRT